MIATHGKGTKAAIPVGRVNKADRVVKQAQGAVIQETRDTERSKSWQSTRTAGSQGQGQQGVCLIVIARKQQAICPTVIARPKGKNFFEAGMDQSYDDDQEQSNQNKKRQGGIKIRPRMSNRYGFGYA